MPVQLDLLFLFLGGGLVGGRVLLARSGPVFINHLSMESTDVDYRNLNVSSSNMPIF